MQNTMQVIKAMEKACKFADKLLQKIDRHIGARYILMPGLYQTLMGEFYVKGILTKSEFHHGIQKNIEKIGEEEFYTSIKNLLLDNIEHYAEVYNKSQECQKHANILRNAVLWVSKNAWRYMYETSTFYINHRKDSNGDLFYEISLYGGNSPVFMNGEAYSIFKGTPQECMGYIMRHGDKFSIKHGENDLKELKDTYKTIWS